MPIDTGDLLARYQHRRPLLVAIDEPLALHRSVNHVVEILSRLVVWRDDKRRLRIFDVLVCDRGQALLAWPDFVHAALLVKAFSGAVHVSTRELFDDRLQLWIALPDDLIEMRGPDPRFLDLVIRSAGVDRFVLTHVGTP